jgi:hypothetical protein
VFNLLDLMRAAQGGAAMESMARQFGLSVDQTQRALEALMPAFYAGFQRNAADPTGFANLLRMMGSGRYADFFDRPAQAFTPFARTEGNGILAQLFGNKDVTRQVAQQAAAWAGIAPEIMKQMLPAVAPVLMGGLFRSAASEGLADYFDQLAQMLRGGTPGAASAGPRPALPRGPANASDPFGLWSGMMGQTSGGGRSLPAPPPAKPKPKPKPEIKRESKAEPPSEEGPSVFGPWGDMMNAMLGAGKGAAPEPEPEPEPEPPSPPEPPPPQNPFDFLSRMFETGREAQEQHLATMQGIFDSYWGSAPKRR